ncbi:two-partner secretion domain-containing protein [Lyngbya aestuarii]|uniref:two-partner secretion domain-containing protein n=1 Tax=Lyngbya aestuarii TaxID=118322 RepID=UPI00403DA31B
MLQNNFQLWFSASITLLCLVTTSPTLAQIIPDDTLETESSLITPNVEINGLPSDQIEGGAIRGANLFHSFEQFNIEAGRGAYFANPTGIENILSRVTGDNLSDIQGTLGVLGNANLFLINPNGILFGANASLDVNGSFLATTATAIGWGELGLFSASEPATSNLLTINPSVFFFNARTAETIVNQSQAESFSGETNSVGFPVGLQVPNGQTLALIGGDVVLEAGNLTAAEGRIELGSVAGVGEVGLTRTENDWVFSYDAIHNLGNIGLEGGSTVDVSGEGGGSLQIQGARLEVKQGSIILADNFGVEAGKELLLKTTESVTFSESSLIVVGSLNSGTGGDLTIETGKLIVQDGAQIFTPTFGEGNAGNLTVRASTVELAGTGADGFSSNLSTTSEPGATGTSGNLTIETAQLVVRDGAQVAVITSGEGNAGNLTVLASNVELAGTDQAGFPSGLFATAQGLTGAGGNLLVEAEQLIVRDGAQVSVITFGGGDAGDLTVRASEIRLIGTAPSQLSNTGLIPSSLLAGTEPGSTGTGGNLTIETSRLIIQDGAQAQASTLGEGDAGNLIVTASELIELIGTTADGQFPSGLLTVSGLEGVTTEATGLGGNLTIETGKLIIRDGATVNVSSANPTSAAQGAGNLEVQAQAITLDNQGTITAETASGDGGDLTLQVEDLLQLRRKSNISTTAGTAQAGGDGGNIGIEARLIVAIPSEDSNITANAFTGQGGNIQIDAESIVGIEPREEETLLSDITASSELGIAGNIEINTLDIDPSRGLVSFPEDFVDPSRLIAQNCPRRDGLKTAQRSEFYVTGRGGLPASPTNSLTDYRVLVDWVTLDSEANNSNNVASAETVPSESTLRAQGWVIAPNGKVILTAQTPTIKSEMPRAQPAACSGF